MVEVTHGTADKTPQWHRRQERLKRIREQMQVKRVRVVPRDDIIRRDIVHGVTRVRFPKEGSVEWPLDQFTKRRLREGVVTLEGKEAQEARARSRAQSAQATPKPTQP
jgi:hypothetical protein